MLNGNLAAIDLGTNSCRISIADAQGNKIYREAETVKLGEGLYKNMCFTSAAIERGLRCLGRYADLMQDYEVKSYRAIATASCRMASNGRAFVQQVKEACGICLDIIDGQEEALLTLKGAQLNADKNMPYLLVYDLGGGSTEITLATNSPKAEILHTISIPWGARNASEAFGLSEYSAEKAAKLRAEIVRYVEDFSTGAAFSGYREKCCCVATSSTPLRLLSMVKNIGSYSKDYADGSTVETAQISAVIDGISKMNLSQMKKSPYIGPNRGPIFVSACVIFRTIYEELKLQKITASLKGAQEAIIQELIENGKTHTIGKIDSRP